MRNIGISAHIDSGKTTLTERILFYTGKIKKIHEVRGKDGVGAKMDSMELEREKGITIKSAATFTQWKDHDINIIDTPGHVDFTIEVERSMRVLDGAVLVVCGASGVQSQTMTVNNQMNRYQVARIAFINKLDRTGADAFKVCEALRTRLKTNSALVQIPIGTEKNFEGVIDVINMSASYFRGEDGETVIKKAIPKEYKETALKTRNKLIEAVSEVDEELEELFLDEKEPTVQQLIDGIRRTTISRKFTPVFLGSAFKNKGVQNLLDGVNQYLPSPLEVDNYGYSKKAPKNETGNKKGKKLSSEKNKAQEEENVIKNSEDAKENKKEEQILLKTDREKPLLCLAFKLEESAYGQLTWIRIYQGVLRKGDSICDVSDPKKGKRIKVGKIVKMHSEEYIEVNQVSAGEIAALFGVECDSGTTFGSVGQKILLTNMKVPDPVISLAVTVLTTDRVEKFSRAVKRFMREDPTFKMTTDKETGETLFSGMGELHLDIYIERLKREYGVKIKTSQPRVSYKESITKKVSYNYLHKKQTGGNGQYGRVIGYIEPIPEDDPAYPYEFVNKIRGLNIPSEFIPSINKSFLASMEKGPLVGGKVMGVRMVLEDGVTHEVDSSEFSFFQATKGALREAMRETEGLVYEPMMKVEVTAPLNFQNNVVSSLSRRGAIINNIQRLDEILVVEANVALEEMFGYSSDIRGCTEGKGEFSMEYIKHEPVPSSKQRRMTK